MKNKNSENEKMPYFEQLNDRIIVEPTKSPTLVIKTNLDSDDPTEDNPYYTNKDEEKIKQYFDDK